MKKSTSPKIKMLKPANQANAEAFAAAVATPKTVQAASQAENSPYARAQAFRLGNEGSSNLEELRDHLTAMLGSKPTATAALKWALNKCVQDFRKAGGQR